MAMRSVTPPSQSGPDDRPDIGTARGLRLRAPGQGSSSSPFAPSAGPPIDKQEARTLATRDSDDAPNDSYTFDDPSIDPILMGIGLSLATSARDESIRLGAWHDLMDARGHFARARAKAAAGAAVAVQRAALDPAVFAALLSGLGDCGLAPPAATTALAAAVASSDEAIDAATRRAAAQSGAEYDSVAAPPLTTTPTEESPR